MNSCSRIFKLSAMATSMLCCFSMAATAAERELSSSEADKQAKELKEIINEIVITSRLRPEVMQDVPVTVKAFSEAEIESAGITSMRDYAALTPNFSLQETQNSGFAFVNMRGLSTQRNTEQAVAVSVDGVVLTNSLIFSQDLFDLQQIEVLKGPQGALYGRNSAGGAINITTRKPTNDFEGMVRAGTGNGDAYKVQGTVSGPVIKDTLLFRIAVSEEGFDGTRENITLHQPTDPYKESAMRGKLLWIPTDSTTVDLRFSYSDSRAAAGQFVSNAPVAVDLPGFVTGALGTGGAGIPRNGSTVFNPKAAAAGVGGIVGDANNTSVKIWGNQPGMDSRKYWNLSAKIDVKMDAGTLTSITSFDDIKHLTEGEQLFYLPKVTAGSLNAILAQNRFGDSWSQEFRFASPDDQPLRWIVGSYAAHTDLDVYYAIMDDLGKGVDSIGRIPNPRSNAISPTKLYAAQFAGSSGGIPAPITNPATALAALGDKNDNFAYAFFGQANYDLTKALELSLALRYDRDERKQTGDIAQEYLPQYKDPVTGAISGPVAGQVRERAFNSVQPKVSLRWKQSDNLTLYGVYSKGFRSGGFNPGGVSEAIAVMVKAGVAGLPSGVQDSFDKEESKSFELGMKSTWADGHFTFNASVFTTTLDNTFAFFFVGTNAAQTNRNIAQSDIAGFEMESTWRVSKQLSFSASYGMIDSEIRKSGFLGVGGINLVGNELPNNPENSLNLGMNIAQPLGRGMTGFFRADYQRIGKMEFSMENWGPRDPVNLVNLRGGVKTDSNWELSLWVKNATNENYFSELFNTYGIGYYAPERRLGADVTYKF